MKTKTVYSRCVLILAASVLPYLVYAAEIQVSEHAKALHAKLAPALKPAVREWVAQESRKIAAAPRFDEVAVKTAVQQRFAGQLAGGDIEAIAFIVLMEAAKSADADLKGIMAGVQSMNQQKAAQRQSITPSTTNTIALRHVGIAQKVDAAKTDAKDKRDSTSEMSEPQSLRLQMAMDRRAKMISTLSNLEKKVSETQSNIVQNLK